MQEPSGMLNRVLDFPSQIARARHLKEDYPVAPTISHEINKIIFLGMGGSGVLGDTMSVLLRNSGIPAHVCKSSIPPTFVDNKSLVIVVSYSGKTWETLRAMQSCMSSGARVAVISSSYELTSVCNKKSIPAIRIPENGQARSSFGYLLVSTLNLLYKAGIVNQLDQDLSESVMILNDIKNKYGFNGSSKTNRAYEIALEFLHGFPVIYGEHNFTDAVALRWKQLINENSKVHCYCDTFPELLHNEIEVWNSSAHDFRQDYSLVMLRDFAHEKEIGISEKVDATKRLIQEKGTRIIEMWSQGKSELARLLSLNYIGEFVSIYLAIAKGIDPSAIPNIQAIKRIGLEQGANRL